MAKRGGGSRGQKRAAKSRARRSRLAHEERRREDHARLVVERSGDPRFVQRTTEADGRTTISWHRETATGRALGEGFAAQTEAFQQRFGRPPGPDDPLMFDPDAEVPTALTEQRWTEKLNELITTLESRGESTVFVKAWRDLGYLVTTENQHTFSAAEVQAWEDTIAAYDDEDWITEYDDLFDDEHDEEMGIDELLDTVDGLLRSVVVRTLSERSSEPARHMTRLLVSGGAAMSGTDPGEDTVPQMACAVAVGWLVGVRDRDPGTRMAPEAIAWVRSEIGDGPAESASRAGALLGSPSALGADLTLAELADELGGDFLPALLWLCTGAVARFGDGGVGWLPAASAQEDG